MAGTRVKNHSDGHLNLTYVRIYLGTIPIITGASFCYISVKAGSQSGEIANSDMVLGRSWDVSTNPVRVDRDHRGGGGGSLP